MRQYGQFCPLAKALDVVGDRWTLLIVRELAERPCRYTDLRDGLPGGRVPRELDGVPRSGRPLRFNRSRIAQLAPADSQRRPYPSKRLGSDP